MLSWVSTFLWDSLLICPSRVRKSPLISSHLALTRKTMCSNKKSFQSSLLERSLWEAPFINPPNKFSLQNELERNILIFNIISWLGILFNIITFKHGFILVHVKLCQNKGFLKKNPSAACDSSVVYFLLNILQRMSPVLYSKRSVEMQNKPQCNYWGKLQPVAWTTLAALLLV